jgi:3-hydroxyacyl-[acyl-carrier-protein] dehydratase
MTVTMDRAWIERMLPHRDPFLLIESIESLEPGTQAVGWKQVRADDHWVPGHFPGFPVMPGVLVAEALAQVAAIVFLSQHANRVGRPVYLVGFEKMRFRRPVRIGDALRLEVQAIDRRRRMWTFSGSATVDGVRVADGTFLATVPDLEGSGYADARSDADVPRE